MQQGSLKKAKLEEATRLENDMSYKTYDAVASVVVATNPSTGVATTPFLPNSGASAGCLNQVPQGNTPITRLGRKITNCHLRIRAFVPDAITSTLSTMMTWFLVWDRAPNQAAALPPWTTVFNSQNPTTLTNVSNSGRFEILRTWDFCYIYQAGSLGTAMIDELVDLEERSSYWTAASTTGLYPTMQTGALLLYCVADDNTTSSLVSTRLYYRDE